MGDSRRRNCKVCGKHSNEVGELSWNGYCRPCGKALLEENVNGLIAGRGFAHRRWLKGYARMLERQTLDVLDKSA